MYKKVSRWALGSIPDDTIKNAIPSLASPLCSNSSRTQFKTRSLQLVQYLEAPMQRVLWIIFPFRLLTSSIGEVVTLPAAELQPVWQQVELRAPLVPAHSTGRRTKKPPPHTPMFITDCAIERDALIVTLHYTVNLA